MYTRFKIKIQGFSMSLGTQGLMFSRWCTNPGSILVNACDCEEKMDVDKGGGSEIVKC